jgi:acetyl/propionyl-CoA carboxylase alpha subunit
MKYTAIIHGERAEIDLNRIGVDGVEAQIGGRTYTAKAREVEPGVYWFDWNNTSFDIRVTENVEGYAVSIGLHRIPVEILDSRAALRRAAHHGPDGVLEIRAPMPGKIVKVLLPEGSEVQSNQGIVVMEAMKMQNEIKSTKNGVVRKLTVTEGTAVNAGDLLAEIE